MKKTAVITGASRGIGKACALQLAGSFDCIAINSCSHTEELENVRQEIIQSGTECIAVPGDISNGNFVCHFIDEVIKNVSSIDLLVNNAGISHIGLLTDLSFSEWQQIINTNLSSVFYCCHEVVPHMLKRKSGHIINISSIWGLSGASCEVAYSAAKGGVNAFTMALAKELAPSNIRVNALACGAINTNMNACFSKEEMDIFCEEIPMGRMGTPEEIAQAVMCLYNSPSYLTGEIIKIDGGYL